MSPRPQLPAEEIEARRTAILESTVDEIAGTGLENVRMKDVAAGAGMSVGTIQYYFQSRDELLVQALSMHSSRVVAAIAALSAAEGSAWEKLQLSFRAVPAVDDYPKRARVWVELVSAARRRPFLQDAVTEVFARWTDHFERIVSAGIGDGSFRPQAEVSLIVETIVAQIDGFDLAVASGRPVPPAERISRSLELTAAALLGVPLDHERPPEESARGAD
ncbi:TetR/AcrR family transcriptional regulator [Brevibacterium sp.]|uniref:TetR/AcrR family transcriptional regulator n=1 Tax=Brevibacterium sp. TaxID=1701 RepID=UPI00281238E8|nr:TetR/AcrR family transcriptional regulator [Brevibacterium sp.]